MHDGPAAVRYPRGTGPGVQIEKEMQQLPIGKANIVRHGTQVAILNFGTLLNSVIDLSDEMDFSVFDMRFIKPLDKELLIEAAKNNTFSPKKTQNPPKLLFLGFHNDQSFSLARNIRCRKRQ